MSSSNSPCAACKLLRRKCTQGCVFAPYFPPDQPNKFAYVHRVFGASNVAKLLNELSPAQREDAVNSLAYEAQARLSDPVHGCVGYIYLLQHRLDQVQNDLNNAKKELATYIGPAALGPFLPQQQRPLVSPHFSYQYNQGLQVASPSAAQPFGIPGMGMGLGLASPSALPHAQILMREQQHQQQQMAEAQHQLAVAVAEAAREQELLRSYGQQQQQQQQQQELARFNAGFPDGCGRGYNLQMGVGAAVVQSPLLDGQLEVQQQQQLTEQPQQHHHLQPVLHRTASDEGRSGVGPSS